MEFLPSTHSCWTTEKEPFPETTLGSVSYKVRLQEGLRGIWSDEQDSYVPPMPSESLPRVCLSVSHSEVPWRYYCPLALRNP